MLSHDPYRLLHLVHLHLKVLAKPTRPYLRMSRSVRDACYVTRNIMHHNLTAGTLPSTPHSFMDLSQVSSHSTPLDCWVSFLGGVYNITRIIKVLPRCLLPSLKQCIAPLSEACCTGSSCWRPAKLAWPLYACRAPHAAGTCQGTRRFMPPCQHICRQKNIMPQCLMHPALLCCDPLLPPTLPPTHPPACRRATASCPPRCSAQQARTSRTGGSLPARSTLLHSPARWHAQLCQLPPDWC
jgi:hypothetical protein